MKYILSRHSNPLQNKLPLDYSTQSNLFARKDSHIALLKEIINRIADHKLSRDIRTRVGVLKGQRVKADYDEYVFSEEEGLDVLRQAEYIINQLDRVFK